MEPAGPTGDPVPALAPWEGAAFMATGAALVVHIVFDVPLWLSVALALGTAGAVLVMGARRHAGSRPAGPGRVIAAGALTAVVALVAYDSSRLAVATVLAYEVGPFEAFRHFGSGLIGSSASPAATWTAGTLFHVANAVTFGIAYTIWFGRRGVWLGVLFGLGLEAAMIGFYPAWLQIPNMREFLSMSVVGHIAYGGTLGALSGPMLDRVARDRGPEVSATPS